MNMMNIEQITQEVVSELMNELYLQKAHTSAAVPYKRILILLNRSDLPIEVLTRKLEAWKDRAEIHLLAPRWARSLWNGSHFEQRGLSLETASFDRAQNAQELMNQADRLAIVGCTRTLLQKLGRLDQSTLPSALCVEALQRNKPVMLLDDAWESHAQAQKKMQSMGLQLGNFDDVERIFPLPPQPILPAQAFQPVTTASSSATATGKPSLPANCQSCTQFGQCATLCNDRVARLMEIGAQRISTALGIHPVPENMAGMIDHTLLKPEATEAQIRQLCKEAAQYHFASVCVNPGNVPLSAELLKGSGVMVCTVIGFPLGATDTETKADETRHAIGNGADEIDMVINVGALKSHNDKKVEEDIRAVVQAAQGRTVKVILETGLLNDEEKVRACRLSEKAGAHFVKTSTGFGPGGATEQDIALMRRTVRPGMEVKASGGIRDQEKALKMIQAGATRIGASASIAIVSGEKASGGGKY